MNKILFVTIILLFKMCNPDIRKTYYDNGNIKKECIKIENKKIQCTEYYLSGTKKLIAHIKDGKQDGKTITYYENGSIEREIFFKNGIQQDTMTIYYPNGNIMERSIVKDGIKNGMFIHYRENGSKQVETIIKEGQFDGICTYFKESGEIANTIVFENGIPINWVVVKNDTFNFSISYPDDWKKASSQKANTLLAAFDNKKESNYKANINIVPLNINKTEPLKNVMNIGIKELKQSYPSFHVIHKDSHTIQYELTQEGYKIRGISKILLCDEQYLLLTSAATTDEFEYYEPIFDLITVSFTN